MKLTLNTRVSNFPWPEKARQVLTDFPFTTVRSVLMREVSWVKDPANLKDTGSFKGGQLMEYDEIGKHTYETIRRRLIKAKLPDLKKLPAMFKKDPYCLGKDPKHAVTP